MGDFSLMCRTFTFNRLSPGTDFLISIIATKGLKRSHPTVLMVSTCKFILYLINFSWVKGKSGKLLHLKSITSCVCVQAHLCLTLQLHGLQPTRLPPVHGIFQARILEWVAISFSRGSSQSRNQIYGSCIFCICRQILYHWRHLGNPNI